jgi:hypothetical protein
VNEVFMALRQRGWNTTAILSQLATAVYLQVVEWIHLFPWNDLSKGNMQERLDVALLAGQLLIAYWFLRQRLALMCLGWLGYAAWLYLQIDSWWEPYLLGGRSVGPTWYFARTFKFLPQIADRPTPDANHVVLQLLIVAVLVSGAMAIWHKASAVRAAKGAP